MKNFLYKVYFSIQNKLHNEDGDISLTTIIIWSAVITAAGLIAGVITTKFDDFKRVLENIQPPK